MDEPFYYLSAEDRVPLDVVHVIVGGSIRVVPPFAFSGCQILAKVELREGVEEIGTRAFANCPNLAWVDCPSSLRTIGNRAFAFCKRLSEAILREGLRRIGARAFLRCGLRRLVVPSSVLEIGEEAFANCDDLEAATLVGGIVLVARGAFSRCPCQERIAISSMAIVAEAGEDGNRRTVEVPRGIENDGDDVPEPTQLIWDGGGDGPARLILTSRYLALMSQEDRTKFTDSIDEVILDRTRGAGPLNLEDGGVSHQIRVCFANCLAEYLSGIAAVLELVLWKANMNQRREASPGRGAGGGETARVDVPTRDDCRRTCGADIVIGPVLSYLWGPHRRADQEEDGASIQL